MSISPKYATIKKITHCETLFLLKSNHYWILDKLTAKDALFEINKVYDENIAINEDANIVELAISYKIAADTLFKIWETTNQKSYAMSAILFLYRHFLELMIKGVYFGALKCSFMALNNSIPTDNDYRSFIRETSKNHKLIENFDNFNN